VGLRTDIGPGRGRDAMIAVSAGKAARLYV